MIENHYLLLLSLSLLLIDVAIVSEIPSWIAIGLISYVAVDVIDLSWEYSIPLYIAIFMALMLFYYLIWRRLVEKIVDRFIAPEQFKSRHDGIIGKPAEIIEIDGKNFARVDGEIFSFEYDGDIEKGKTYKIIAQNSNILTLGEH